MADILQLGQALKSFDVGFITVIKDVRIHPYLDLV